jgi:hypothetical protein
MASALPLNPWSMAKAVPDRMSSVKDWQDEGIFAREGVQISWR